MNAFPTFFSWILLKSQNIQGLLPSLALFTTKWGFFSKINFCRKPVDVLPFVGILALNLVCFFLFGAVWDHFRGRKWSRGPVVFGVTPGDFDPFCVTVGTGSWGALNAHGASSHNKNDFWWPTSKSGGLLPFFGQFCPKYNFHTLYGVGALKSGDVSPFMPKIQEFLCLWWAWWLQIWGRFALFDQFCPKFWMLFSWPIFPKFGAVLPLKAIFTPYTRNFRTFIAFFSQIWNRLCLSCSYLQKRKMGIILPFIVSLPPNM